MNYIKEKKNIKIIEKRSQFYGYIFPLLSIDEVDKIIYQVKLEHKKYTHFITAYRYEQYSKYDADKEVSGIGGYTTISLLEKMNINNCLVIIVRYYGGSKLGVGPLIRTYNQCVKNLCENNIIKML